MFGVVASWLSVFIGLFLTGEEAISGIYRLFYPFGLNRLSLPGITFAFVVLVPIGSTTLTVESM